MAANKPEYMREYYAENKDRILAANAAWRARNPELHKARAREYHHENKDEINRKRREKRKANPGHYRALRRTRIYGLLPVEIEMMEVEQRGCCAICKEPAELVIDHDHETGAIRELLCSNCNTAVGLLQDDPQRARLAAAYLEKHAMMKAEAVSAKAGRPGGR